MRIFPLALAVMLQCTVALLADAQSIGASASAQTSAGALVEGLVIKDSGSEPVKKALIELIAENQATGGDYTAITGADGTFRISGILPGRYRLIAERTGFVEMEKHHPRSSGRLLTLTAGQELKDVVIRLQATSAIDGRVTDEDGDALADAQVAVLRRTFARGRSHWEQIGAERTNDLGEYRIAGLPAGQYYISVTPPPDFKSLIEAASNAPAVEPKEQAGGQECPPRSHFGAERPAITSYITTYYPGVKDRAQAATVQLREGEDFPANFSLTPSPSVTIHGSIGRVAPGASAAVGMRASDFNSALNGAEVHKDGSFEIRDVSPGTYTLLATVTGTASQTLLARQTIEVGQEDITELHLTPQPGGEIRGRLRLENDGLAAKSDFSQFFLVLRPADGDEDVASAFALGDSYSDSAPVASDGSFAWHNVPPGRYFVVLAADGAASPDWFLKSVVAGGRESSEVGINVNGGTIALDVVASSDGGLVNGLVGNHKSEPVLNATVVLVPEERFRSRSDRYKTTVTDQSGSFVLHGIPPGSYMLLAWETLEGEQYYDPEFLKSFEGRGRALRIAEGERANIQLEAIPDDQK
jgi:hypothetical protein